MIPNIIAAVFQCLIKMFSFIADSPKAMSQKISDTNILTGEPLISSTPPLILLQSEEDLTSDLSPNQTGENPSSSTIDSASDVTLLDSKAEDTGISNSNAGSCDPVPSTENSKLTSSGTASSSVHDESWNIENLLTEVILHLSML